MGFYCVTLCKFSKKKSCNEYISQQTTEQISIDELHDYGYIRSNSIKKKQKTKQQQRTFTIQLLCARRSTCDRVYNMC